MMAKAVHLELIVDLTTDSFLNVFKRFAGRRGLPEKIYSDNPTSFVGANNVLKDPQRGVECIFIPPRAPHFGGL